MLCPLRSRRRNVGRSRTRALCTSAVRVDSTRPCPGVLCDGRGHALAGAEAGLLDVVCGFQILDEHCRMIVVEGLAGALQRLSDAVPRASANDKACRILNNLDVCFHRRLYTAFNVDLKKIRLRDPLPILCEMPEIYNRTKV